MPVDPRLNCAAEICCSPTLTDGAGKARESRKNILADLGAGDDLAWEMADAMKAQGLCFMPQALADTIREVAFPDGSLRLEPFMEIPGEPTG